MTQYVLYTECIQCHKEIGPRFVMVNNGGDRQYSICWTCFNKLIEDATVGQFIRIKGPKLYNDIISVPEGQLKNVELFRKEEE